VVPWAYYWAIDGGTSECKWRTRDSRTRRVSWIAWNWRWLGECRLGLGYLEASGLNLLDAGLSRIWRRRITTSESTTVSEDIKVDMGEPRTLSGGPIHQGDSRLKTREIRPSIFNSNKQVKVSLLLVSSQTGGTKLSLICCPSTVRTYWFTATDDYRVVTRIS